jgi:hypothetical protein
MQFIPLRPLMREGKNNLEMHLYALTSIPFTIAGNRTEGLCSISYRYRFDYAESQERGNHTLG